MVEKVRPQATTIPMEFHISAPSPLSTASGIIPSTVVKVVIKIGRRRERPPATTASLMVMPRSTHKLV